MIFRNSSIKAVKIKPKTTRFILTALIICVFGNSLFARVDNPVPTTGGTQIINRAEARYEDETGLIYTTVSPTVIITVLEVPAITVTPDQTASSAVIAPNEHITREFRICNTGNSENTFLPVEAVIDAPAQIAEIYFDTDNSGTVTNGDTPVIINQTITPRLAVGACLGVLYVIDTNAVTPQTQISIHLTARSTIVTPGTNNFPPDSGTIINTVGNGVIFTSPNDTSLPPVKLVENLPRTTAAPGQTLNYTIAFRNNGAVNARQVRVTDDLPAELEYVPNTLRLDNRSLTDAPDTDEGQANARRLELLIPEIAPAAVTEIKFQARLIGAINGNGVVNFARVAAANAPAVNSSNAVAVVNPIGTVYAGNSGGAVRLAGAIMTLAVDENNTPLILESNGGYTPNAENVNPFNSDANGNFSFALAANQIGASGNPVRYLLNVTAPAYRSRQIEITIQPNGGANGFYTVRMHALDGQSVAVADGFALTTTTVELANLAALVFNVPMFELSTLEISKSADKQYAEIGDIVSYRLQVKNSSAATLNNVFVRDLLPASFVYANGTAQLQTGRNAAPVEPQINGSELVFPIGELAAGQTATITYRVRVGANAPEGEHINSAVATGVQLNGETISTQPAQAIVRIRGGVFSMRQIVIGRVFEDRNGNGKFDKGERPVAGARIYTNSGQSVVTDPNGNYNLPAVSKGSLVLSLDPLTLPENYFLADEKGRKSAKSWTRLLRTPLGGGSLLRQNFAIAPQDESAAVADDQKVITAKGVFTPKTQNSKKDKKVNPVQAANLEQKVSLEIAPPTNDGKSTETYTVASTENVEKVAAGDLLVLSPETNAVVMSPALSVTARVAKDWTIEAEVNGEKIGVSNIGETRVDNRNQVTTYSFVGIGLKPGENDVILTAIDADGGRGKSTNFKVFGRGAAEKVEVTTKKSDTTGAVSIEIHAFDQWGNPAADGQISVETSAGRIYNERAETVTDETAQLSRQQIISIVNGTAQIQLISDGAADTARLKIVTGSRETFADVRFEAELRPTLLVGLGEFSFGKNAPEIVNAGDNSNFRSRLALYYRGRAFGENLLTLAYDSQQALNRVAGRDRFGGFDPLDRSYPIFGDSSQRFEDAQSNSKLYARIDRRRSYAMFGDMEADLDQPTLSGYSRKLTGVKLHLENDKGDFISVTGARPDTAFSRDVIPGGGLSIVRLSHGDILPGSEVLTLEVRDRRNPDIIISRENLIRSVDYNLDAQTGEVFFLRPIAAFDYALNLMQVVAAYEHRGVAASNYVYTARAVKNFARFGIRFGASYINQQQSELGAFQIGGFDAEKTLSSGGKLNLEAAMSRGRFASGVNVFDFYNGGFTQTDDAARERSGQAFRLRLDQPLPFFHSNLKADFSRSSAGYFNPFGASVAPGAQRLQVALEIRPKSSRNFTLGFTDERNKTANVSNSRQTFSFLWSEQWRDNLRSTVGFDRRSLRDNLTDRTTDSSLLTAAIEYRPTSKIELSVKREQNLTEADPTYPNQTTFAANYLLNADTKVFFTQRLAAAPITPIGDFSSGGSGFSATAARHETAFGIESKISRLGALSGRYQIENGANGADNFAVIGLQNRWSLTKKFAVEGGFERGFLVKGSGKSFNSATFGGEWIPVEGFRASARYELRDRNGFGQIFSFGAAGKIGENWTTLARAQFSRTSFNNRGGASSNITAAAAYRPLDSDKYALLFSYNHRENFQKGTVNNGVSQAAQREKFDTLSSDGLYRVNRDLEIYGRFALRFNGNGNNSNIYTSALTLTGQIRAQQRLTNQLDVAAEYRLLMQPASNTFRRSAGAEIGFWIMPDLRLGAGYNFTQVNKFNNILPDYNRASRGGFYFTVTTKLSNLFDLFGTSRQGLEKQKKSSKDNQIALSKDK